MADDPDYLQDLLGRDPAPEETPEEAEEAVEDRFALPKEDRDKIAAWMNDKAKNHACPVCDTTAWTVGGHLMNGQVHTPGGVYLGGVSTYPMAFLVCNNCFYVRQFMAIPMGLDFLKEEGEADG